MWQILAAGPPFPFASATSSLGEPVATSGWAKSRGDARQLLEAEH